MKRERYMRLLVGTIVTLSLAACGTTAEVGTISSNASDGSSITGTVSAEGIEISKMLVLESVTNEAQVVDIEDSSFSATVDAGSYSLTLLDDDNSPVALLVQEGESIFTVDGETDVGTLSVDAETNTMSTTKSLTAASTSKALGTLVDLTDLLAVDNVDLDNGLDVTTLLDSTDGDGDDDLVPDFLDNDNNEDGIYDINQGMTLCIAHVEAAADESSTILAALKDVACKVFDNLKLQSTDLLNGDGDILPHTDDHTLALHLQVPTVLVPSIARVTIVPVPSFADGTIAPLAGGWTAASYPTAGDAWSSHGHEIPHATDPSGDDVYSLWINAADDPAPAIFVFRVTLSSGTVAEFVTRLAYVFNTPPKITQADDGSTITTLSYPRSDGDTGTRTHPIMIASSGTLQLTAHRPLTHAGGVQVCGMTKTAHIFYLDASGNQLNTSAVQTTPVLDTDPCLPGTTVTLAVDITTDLPSTYDGASVASYQIDFTFSGSQNDNAAEILYFTR